MLFDDEELPKKNGKPKLRDLSTWSIGELNDYIEQLKTEIKRAEETIASKQGSAAAAAAFFKK